jgi:hypothetical protein
LSSQNKTVSLLERDLLNFGIANDNECIGSPGKSAASPQVNLSNATQVKFYPFDLHDYFSGLIISIQIMVRSPLIRVIQKKIKRALKFLINLKACSLDLAH